ncbi:FadR family transcriptional regulator [Microbacterium sp. Sa4CUA7]|uniref:FadR family transcriptional regulator n=1 Tax=Microbacterium pullorum TaxID=2762236 RepID=A0ABR8RYJ8_9MICO|nr:FCD domain-containing protein [Microbacterium pullorum]MBD7956296.1 FadR family transcriptional regulator [Microbacterium pullorum]
MTEKNEAPARAWKVVLDKIETDLIEGRLGPGDRLPSERDLVAQLGVGRSSVREALRVLEVMGLIRTGTGSGPGAGAIVISSPTGGMSALLRLQVAAQGFPIDDVVATRLFVEEWIVATLAANPAADLETARATVEAMDAAPLQPEEFLALDAQFHYALAAASENSVVAATMAGLRSSIEGYTSQIAARIVDWPAASARLRHEHHQILDAIDAGDAERARALIPQHISGYFAP